MIKEYRFGAFIYDEHTDSLRCPNCGKNIEATTAVAKVHGRWFCIPCVHKDALPYSDLTPAKFLIEAAKR